MAGQLAVRMAPWLTEIRKDIYRLCDALNFQPNRHQRMLFNAVMRAKYGQASPFISVKSGQGTGKTAGSCVVVLWCLIRAHAAMTMLSAPTMKQCTDVWLAEMRRILADADPIFRRLVEITNTNLRISGERDWGVKTCAATKPENFQGRHEDSMSIMFEEASGIPRNIFETAKGTLTNEDKLMVAIGNPNTRDCALFDCFYGSMKHEWQLLTFNAEETPKSKWFDPDRNRRIGEEYGYDSDVYRVRVLGEFPHTDPQCVISSEDVEAAFDPKLTVPAMSANEDRQIGLDFARFGGDENTVLGRRGYAIIDRFYGAGIDPNNAVERAFKMQADMQWTNAQCQYVADAGGMGQGVMRRFYDAGKRIHEFHNNGTPTMPDYANKISEGYFHLGRLLRDRKAFLGRNDPKLVAQLSNRRYYTDAKGKLILETKDDYLKRFEDSPDRADGVVLTYFPGAMAQARIHFADRGKSR